MFYALDKDGIRTPAYEARKEAVYTCPVCNGHVILKRGAINIDHFAHESNSCEDHWNYDMSEWHKRMQNYFPKEAQEVVVTYRGKKHRADVLINDVVLEFQNSPITASEFEDRNEFFKNAGYRLAWVFNLGQIPESDLYISEKNENMMIWKHPMRIFANADYLGENNKRFALWFSCFGDDLGEPGEECIERVVWAIKNDDGCYSMRRFFVSSHVIIMGDKVQINPNYFFYSKKDFFKENLSKLKKQYPYTVKYCGKKGEPKQSYICPKKNGKFGIDMWGEKGCFYCRYCYMVAQTGTEKGKMYASYCCYPTQVRELCEGHPGYECVEADVYEI